MWTRKDSASLQNSKDTATQLNSGNPVDSNLKGLQASSVAVLVLHMIISGHYNNVHKAVIWLACYLEQQQ